MGDPAGVGPAMTIQAWKHLREDSENCFFVIGATDLYTHEIPVRQISDPSETAKTFPDALPVLPVEEIPLPPPGHPDPQTAPVITSSIKRAATYALTLQADAVITNPINKALLYGAGFNHPGHTEYIADICSAATGKQLQPVMLLTGGGLRVALATIHIPHREVPDHLSIDKLVDLAGIVAASMQTDFGITAPRIAFTGLNPHAGESGMIGREEIDIINPAAEALRARGIDMSDACSADTVFASALTGQFDAVIAMTHDQGLIPVKTLDMWGGVNTTLGLPIVRTSPDHGTAYEAARTGTARADSLVAAIRLARTMADNRKRAS